MAPRMNNDVGTDDHAAMIDLQVDTEPKAQSSTQVTDEQSILDWVDTQRKERRRWVRKVVIGAVLATLIITSAVASVVWMFWQQ